MAHLSGGSSVMSSFDSLFEYLDQFRGKNLDEISEYLDSLENSQIESLIFELDKRSYENDSQADSVFNFTVDSTLSGEPFPCTGYDCRLRNLDQLVSFSALYADRLFLPTPFELLLDSRVRDIKLSDISFAILQTLKLKPLLEAGILSFTSRYVCVCFHCSERLKKKQNQISGMIDRLKNHISREFSEHSQFVLQIGSDGEPFVSLGNCDEFGFHNTFDVSFREVPDLYLRLLESSHNEPIQLTPKDAEEGGLESLLSPMYDDIFYAMIDSTMRGTTYLSTRPKQVEVMESLDSVLKSEPRASKTNRLSLINQPLPILSNATVEHIVHFRKNDYESFQVYRDTMNSYLKDNLLFDRIVYDELMQDVIIPELHKMDLALKNSRNLFKSRLAPEVGFGIAMITVGHFVGLPVQDISAIVALLGGSEIIANITKNIRKEEIRNSPLYFLWNLSR